MDLREKIARWSSPLLGALLRSRTTVKFFLTLGIFISAHYLAYLIRFEFDVPPETVVVMWRTIPVLVLAKAFGFLVFGQFSGWWRYVSIKDVLPIAAGSALGSVLFAAGVWWLWGPSHVPRSIYVLDWVNAMLLVLGIRYLIRMGREGLGRRRHVTERRVLIVGAGAAGQIIAREIAENVSLEMEQVGFIDDDPAKIGTRIHGVKVLGGHGVIADICRKYDVNEIIIAIPSSPAAVIRHIVEHCRDVTATVQILPRIGDLIGGKVSVDALRKVDLEDLLGRDPVELDTALLSRRITGHTVMVTGAAGSIGSELCRQIARLSPSRLVMFEIAESPLFDFEMEMRETFPTVNVVAVIGDVRDRARVEETVRMYRPSVVYHAAAYKHVPMMEMHPVEAVKTNVLGTRIVAEAAAKFGVERFVLVSTDKAVRPTNVMGATKRLAELVIHNMNGTARKTVFVAVRFGNVLGSAGSVIPIFRRQLETTGKLTVTHPEASRYFMLVSEAAGLILQAGAMGEGGEVFVLEMGKPLKIVDLAENLIRLSGKELGVDAEIVFIGLRPGEKLHEELIVEGEDVTRTSHPKVLKLIGNERMPPFWAKQLEELILCAIAGGHSGVVERLDALVKGYRPDYEFHGAVVPPGAAVANVANASVSAPSPVPPPEGDLPPDSVSPSKSIH